MTHQISFVPIQATFKSRFRRVTIRHSLAVFALTASTLLSLPASAQTVYDVGIAAPDVVAIEVRDPAFRRGRIEKLDAPSKAPHGAWIYSGNKWGLVIGADRSHVRISDDPPSHFLQLNHADNAAGYSGLDGNSVTAVYRKSVPYDSGIFRGGAGNTMTGSSFKHYIYLKLARPLKEGRHKIRWPGNILPELALDYNALKTRAISIRASQHGFRRSDGGKVAYLALWLPSAPNDGAVDFRAYGLHTFQLVDEFGKPHFESRISLRSTPTTPEPGNGLGSALVEYPSNSDQPVAIQGITVAQALKVSAPKHGFVSGQRIWLDGFDGANKRFNGFATVGSVAQNTFEITDGPTGSPAPGSVGRLLAFPVKTSNRAGTYVFELNFGDWKPQQSGTYRIYVPGLGVSDTFQISDDIWLTAAKTAVGGLYNHRSGMALDGRFGFTRPASFKPGQTVEVRLSKLPLAWSTNAGSGFIGADTGGSAPWVTDTLAPTNYWGGYMDAGDWDRVINHVDVSFMLLDVFETAQGEMSAISLGLPKSGDVLDEDIYAGTADLPDILHEAIWNLDFYRRLQLANGGVRGGIESSAHPTLGVPSYLENNTVFTYAPDHVTSYRYAAGAAKLAGVLGRVGNQKLAALFHESAMKAWRYAEDVNKDPDTHYAEVKVIATLSGLLTSIPWQDRLSKIQSEASAHRFAAAASLFRLTGEQTFNDIFLSSWSADKELYLHVADGAWEYYRTRHENADKGIQDRIAHLIVSAARMVMDAQKSNAYAAMKHPFAPAGWGQGLAPDYNQAQMFIRAHQISGDDRLLDAMQRASAHILGANQVGLSFTTGLGHRNVQHPLHEDHRAMGVAAPEGITTYGWAPQAQTLHDWIFGPDWSPIPISGTRDNAQYRRIAPNRFTMPYYEYLIEHPALVIQQEYTVHQTIATTAGIWLYLHTHTEK